MDIHLRRFRKLLDMDFTRCHGAFAVQHGGDIHVFGGKSMHLKIAGWLKRLRNFCLCESCIKVSSRYQICESIRMLDSLIVVYGRSETKVQHGRPRNDKDEGSKKQNLADVNTPKRFSM